MNKVIINEKQYLVKPQDEITKIEAYLSGDKFQQIPIKSPKEIEKLKASGSICARILDEISPHIKVGITRKKINDIILDLITKKYHAEVDRLMTDAQTNAAHHISACFGHNNIVVNAIPDDEILKHGDIFGIDISIKKDGWCGDTRKTWLIGEEISPVTLKLFAVSNYAMWLAMSMVKPGAKISDIAEAVETYTNKQGFSMIKLPVTCGHSLGKSHMDGWLVPLYKSKINEGRVLEEGMVITIETFMSAGNGEGYLLDNEVGSVITQDGSNACYWEHAVAVTDTGCEILDLRAQEKYNWIKF